VATETLVWADQGTNSDQQLADFTGKLFTAAEDGGVAGSGTVEVTATLLGGPSSDVNSNADINPSGVVYNGYTYTDQQLNNTGELYSVYDPGAGGFVPGDNYAGTASPDSSALVLRNLEEDNSSPAGFSHTVSLQLEFDTNQLGTYDDGVENLSFWISDIDTDSGIDRISIVAYGLDGLEIDPTDITFSNVGSNVAASYTTDRAVLDSNGNTETDIDPTSAVQVSIAVPIGRIVVNYFNLGTGFQHISVSNLTFDPIPVVDCFALGTRILTPHGEVEIEKLRVGDRVVILGGAALPIRWIEQRTVWAGRELAPVCVSAGALGNTRDLTLSPAHRVLLSGPRVSVLFAEDEVFVPADALLDGDRIYRMPAGFVSYFHILLDTHEIIYAEGIPAESLLLTGDTLTKLDKRARDEVLAIFPELSSRVPDQVKVARPVLDRAEATLLGI